MTLYDVCHAVFLNRVHTAEEDNGCNSANPDRSTSARCTRFGGGGGTGCRISGSAAGRGRATAGAIALAHRTGLEGVERLIRCWVEGEDHSGFAMLAGFAIEPGWVGVLD